MVKAKALLTSLKVLMWRWKNRKIIGNLFVIENGKYKGAVVLLKFDTMEYDSDKSPLCIDFELYAYPTNMPSQTIDMEELTAAVTSELELFLMTRVD